MAPAELQALLADPRVVWTEDVLRFGDTDANGHINNALFATLCESGRVNLFRTRFDPTLPENRFFVIARLGIDFRAELNFPGRVRTGTWITRLGRSSVSLAQVILCGDTLVDVAVGIGVAEAQHVLGPNDAGVGEEIVQVHAFTVIPGERSETRDLIGQRP